ncbi:MAG TPA: alanine dehydrogenase [Aggregatilineales bacterium]|nr:alanine dehydrogenase [Aggregatilineales bacterium]
MDIGIPAEQPNEYRVGLTPQGVSLLTQRGHRCFVQRGAGEGAGFPDISYERAGARIAYAAEEVYSRADLVLKVGATTPDEVPLLREGQTICAFWHLSAQPREIVYALLKHNISAVSYELIQEPDGHLPVLRPLSEIAGRMAPQIAARWLQNDGGGSGMLIGGLPGIPPIDVAIIGAGVVGLNAARAFLGLGGRVLVLDKDLARLQIIDEQYKGQIVTMVSHDFNVARVARFADVLVGAVLEPGERAPIVVTREMVSSMRPRSVIIDISIDQGGCVETSRPTTHDNPIFFEEDVIHYCVPNMPGVVARTATHAYLNAAWPYIQQLAGLGTPEAVEADPALRRGVVVHDGEITNDTLALLLEEAGA